MLLLTLLLASGSAILMVFAQFRIKHPGEKRILGILLALLLMTAIILLLGDSRAIPLVQLAAGTFIVSILLWRIVVSAFWLKIVYHGLLLILLIWGGYLYTASQLPYEDQPFAALSSNQPLPFSSRDLTDQPLLALPFGNPSTPPATTAARTESPAVPARFEETALEWNRLWPLMLQDSRIRQVLQNLREQQQQNYTAFANQLNSTSVDSTQMRRRALNHEQINDLLKESAISSARYQTLVETWNLLDRDEVAFKKRQLEERFHTLLELLGDSTVDEAHKVALIDYMVAHFAADIRLLNPLIMLYDRLDDEYTRLQRLNQEGLQLYLNKREAILRGFAAIGAPARQPLLDYRRKVLPVIRYSQARLDQFITQHYAVQPVSLYQTQAPLSIANFLNRRKYPVLERFSGPSFSQEYVRRTLKNLEQENAPPQADEQLLHIDQDSYRLLRQAVQQLDMPALDQLLIATDPAVRANLAWQLAQRKAPITVPIIFELMRDQNPDVRRLAAIAIGNFTIKDTQGSSDPKFMEILRMLQNYRSNSDAFGRAWAVVALASLGDQQKALYTLDLLLNDGRTSQSVAGDGAPSWTEAEKQMLQGLIDTLTRTPEELLVKTQALKALQAIHSAEVLDVLLHYLKHVYSEHHTNPTLWRYLIPHMTLPQEAENVEDLVLYLANTQGEKHPQFHKRQLKALKVHLQQSYETNHSSEFFQLLHFLRAFDASEYAEYLEHTAEQIRIMRVYEYVTATYPFWLGFWPLTLLLTLCFSYLLLPALKLEPVLSEQGNHLANPATLNPSQTSVAPAIVPIKITAMTGDSDAH